MEEIAQRIITVLVNTAELKRYSHDPEMLADLRYEVARSYNNSPQLRITWLETIGKSHAANNNWSEAAMAMVHCAAIVAEQLKHRQGSLVSRRGLQPLQAVSVNVQEEQSAASAAEAMSNLHLPIFSDRGLMHILNVGIRFLKEAQRFELVSHLYNIFLPTLEQHRDFVNLALAAGDMHSCYEKILEIQRTKKRYLASYYRVAFFGGAFQSYDGREYIYKEPDVSWLVMKGGKLVGPVGADGCVSMGVVSFLSRHHVFLSW